MGDVRTGLTSRSLAIFQGSLREAVAGGADGEAGLLAALETASSDRRQFLIRGLAHATGPCGVGALRDLIGQRWGVSMRCLLLSALAEREQVASTPDLQQGLRDRDRSVQEIAMRALAVVGSPQATTDVSRTVETWLGDRVGNDPFSAVIYALAFLIRVFAESATQVELVPDYLSRWWPDLTGPERSFVTEVWPGFDPRRPRSAAPPPAGEVARQIGELPDLRDGICPLL